MTLLVLFDRGGIGAGTWPMPVYLLHELTDTDTDETRTIPDAASRMVLFSSDGAFKFAVDLDTESGVSGDGRKLRVDEELWCILKPGYNRVLHLQSSVSSAVLQIEWM